MTWKLLSLGCLCRKKKKRHQLTCGGSTAVKLADEMDQEIDLFSFEISVEASEEQCTATKNHHHDEMSLMSNKSSSRSHNNSSQDEEDNIDKAFLPPELNTMAEENPNNAANENESSFIALEDAATAIGVSSLSSSLGGGASAKSSCASTKSSSSLILPPPPKYVPENEASICQESQALEIESILSQDQDQILIVSSPSSPYDDEEDMPMDELHHWRLNPPPQKKEWFGLPPPPPPLPPPPPPKPVNQKQQNIHHIDDDDTHNSMDADIESFQAKHNNKGNRRGRSTSIATRRSKSSKTSAASHLSQAQENHHPNISSAASTKQPSQQSMIKPWYSLSSASPNISIDKIYVRPDEFKPISSEKPLKNAFVLREESPHESITPSISSSANSFTSDPFSDLSSFASSSKASSNHGIVVVVSEDDEEEDEEEPHDTLYHHSFRILGTTTTSYAEDDEDKYDVLSYNFNKVLSSNLMKHLKKFLPPSCCQDNFWLKYSLVRDVRDFFPSLFSIHSLLLLILVALLC
jgi:hypothetical protein